VADNCDGTQHLRLPGVTGTFTWSNNATTNPVTVNTPGTFTVTQTLNGCTSPGRLRYSRSKTAPLHRVLPWLTIAMELQHLRGYRRDRNFTLEQQRNNKSYYCKYTGYLYRYSKPSMGVPVRPARYSCPLRLLRAPGVTGLTMRWNFTLTGYRRDRTLLWSNNATTNPIYCKYPGTFTVIKPSMVYQSGRLRYSCS